MEIDIGRTLEKMRLLALKTGEALLLRQGCAQTLPTSKDFLSDADLLAEKLILEELGGTFPGIPFLSEEKGGDKITEGYLWVIDPIDGTYNYFRQNDHWGVSIALVKDGETVAGVICTPGSGWIYFSEKGRGAYRQELTYGLGGPELIRVSKEASMKEAQFWVGWGKEEHGGNDHERVYDVIRRLDRVSLYPQIRNSAVGDAMAVACGQSSGFVFPKPEVVDIAAAGLIVEEAGGTVTDLKGQPWSPFSPSFVASNGNFHTELLKVLGEENRF